MDHSIFYPSFLKIMIGDFSTQLGVPPAFGNNFEKMDLRRYCTVSLKFMVEEGIPWKVKLEIGSDGFYYFTRGWSKLAKDLHLALGDLLVFYLLADYDFQLAVYDRTSCLKTLSINPPPITSGGSSSVVSENNAEVKTTPTPREKIMENEAESKKKIHSVKYTKSASNRNFCILPVWFAEEIHKECNKNEVLIKDDEGRKWSMNLKLRVQPTYRRYELISGWMDFCMGNNVVVGDTIQFNHIQGSTIAVRVFHRQ